MVGIHPVIASVVVVTLALFVFWRAGRDYAARGKLTLFTTSLQFLVFLVHGFAYYSFSDNGVASESSRRVLLPVAVPLMAVGITATLGAMLQLSVGDTLGRTVKGLKKTGIYRFSRNPQLIAYFAFLVGYALLTPQWQLLGWLALYVIIAHVMVLTEEGHLRRVCRDEFEDYCRSTPRYLGWRSGTSAS